MSNIENSGVVRRVNATGFVAVAIAKDLQEPPIFPFFALTPIVAFDKSSANGTSIAGMPCGTLGVPPNCSASSWRPELAAGLGFEYGFAQNWSAKFEYLYIATIGSGVTTDHVDTIRAGINYRFGCCSFKNASAATDWNE